MAFPLCIEEHEGIKRRIDSQEELIVAAAVKYQGAIVSFPRPARHGDAINWLHGIAARQPESGYDCGFLTNRGRFVDRAEAGRIVQASGQGSPLYNPVTNPHNHLYSEDMWMEDRDFQAGPIDPAAVF